MSDTLAILGGRPRFESPLHVGRPNIGNREALLQRINGAVDRTWLTNHGVLVQEFERTLERVLGVRHCIAVSNGTVALELIVRGLGLTGEVIVPAFTFVATAHALRWHGLDPVFCDIGPATHLLDPEAVSRAIGPRTSAILGVHLWGEPCQVDALQQLADERGLHLVFDAAHAFGCSVGTRKVGSFGRAEAFSFHATKFVNALEGGAVATNDDDLAHEVRMLRNFGVGGDGRVERVGTNAKMDEFSAAMGLTNLESMGAFIATNERNHAAYARHLAGIPGVSLLPHGTDGQRNHQYVVTEVDATRAGATRDQLLAVLHAERVLARKYFWPGCHRMEPYGDLQSGRQATLPHTDVVAERVLVLPTGTGATEADIEAIADILRRAVACADQLPREDPPRAR